MELRSRANEFVTGSLRYQYDKRSGAEYQARAMTNINNGTADAPTLRQYWLADYEQNLVRAQLQLMPTDVVAVQLRADWRDRDYSGMSCGGTVTGVTITDPTCLGLTGSQRQTYTVDTQWTPSEALQLFGFYTFGKQDQAQNGNNWGLKGTPSNTVGTTTAWWTDTQSTDHTIGLGGNFKLNERWTFGGQYNWVNGTAKFKQGGGQFASDSGYPSYTPLPITPLPDDKFIENAVQLFATWKFQPDTSLRLNYVYSHIKGANWGYDGMGDGYTDKSLAVTNGLRSPNGADQLVYLSLNVRFK